MRVAVIASPYPLSEIPSPPLGVTYVAAAFAEGGAKVRIFDYVVCGYSREKLAEQLKTFQPDVVGANSVTMNFYDAAQILSDVKNCNPEIITIMGGPHVTFTAEETLRNYPQIDLLALGEAEETIGELLPFLKWEFHDKWKNISGVAFRKNNDVVITGRRKLIADVDEIAVPARHLLPITRYLALGFPVSMITGRGCPHSCIFCLGRKMVGAKFRKRKIALILDEMEQILALGFNRINIADDLFAADKTRVAQVCRGIKERGLQFAWSAFARVDTVDEEMFAMMAAAGCDSVSFGVETGNPQMLKRIKKGINLDQVRRAVAMCRRSGMIAHASFIVGLPGETKETLAETEALAKSLGCLYGYHYLAPFPGTTLCENAGQYDLTILTRDWTKYDANDAIVRTSALSPQDIRDFVARYDEEMEVNWRKLLAGYKRGNAALDDLRIEGHWRLQLNYRILQDDLIEKLGVIEGELFKDSPEKAQTELCRRISEAANADFSLVEKLTDDFVRRGYLQSSPTGKGRTWSWAKQAGC